MNFELTSGNYKSLRPFQWGEIPRFVVITGKNGSGKTQLLELLNYHFGINNLAKEQQRSQPSNQFYGVITNSDLKGINYKEVVYIPSIWNLGNISASSIQNFNQSIERIKNFILHSRGDEQYKEIAEIVEQKIGKPKNQITSSDIQKNLPIDFFDYIHRIKIHEGLSDAFKTYQAKYAELRDEDKSDFDIRSEIGIPPWEFINDLLETAGFPYFIEKPTSYLGDYHFQLISNIDHDLKINFEDLSSGEKVLISLSIWMFNSNREKRLPKILLLDEPDAHLHPSAIKQFLEVVEKRLVNEYQVQVFITTHSPTTVALSPSYSIFEINSSPTNIKKVRKKEEGIGILTEGLLVVKSNSKFVLVEDKNDAIFYKSVFSILSEKEKINNAIPIIFIPASNKSANISGGCTVVRNWVEKFVKEGMDDIFQGLMDYDNGTNIRETITETQNLHVVSRYSLENYLLDPILIYSSMLHENSPLNVPGINLQHRDEHRISKLTTPKLQKIADFIFGEIEPLLENLTENERSKISISFINRRKLNYPKWFLERRGHDLFSKFKYKYKAAVNYDKLINAMNRQQFIPKDLELTMKKLQK